MKPHFLPGDQVITRDKQTGIVVGSRQSEVTHAWIYEVQDRGFTVQFVRERDMWHLNETVALERAYARKGRVIPSDHGASQNHPPADQERR